MKLTDEEILKVEENMPCDADGVVPPLVFARAIEAAVLEGVKKRTIGVIAGTSANYEELRAIIDGGSESMTHDDAVKTVKVWADAYAAQQCPMTKVDVEPVGVVERFGVGVSVSLFPRHSLSHGDKVYPASALAAEQAKVRELVEVVKKFYGAISILNDGPDASDEAMAHDMLVESFKMARTALKNNP